MKKQYTTPEIKVYTVEIANVICLSSNMDTETVSSGQYVGESTTYRNNLWD